VIAPKPKPLYVFLRSTALAALSGALLAWSLPPFPAPLLAWVAVVPLLLAAYGRRFVQALGLGLLSGVVCGLGQGYLATPFFLLALLLAVVAAFSTLYRRSPGPVWAPAVAAAAVSAELATTLLPIPLNLALTQFRAVPLLQLCALTGIWGVSFLLWWVNAAVTEAILQRRAEPRVLLPAAGAVALACVGGLVLSTPPAGERMRVAAVQPYSGSGARDALIQRAADGKARLVVTPELSMGRSLDPDAPPGVELARRHKIFLVSAYSQYGRPKPKNCAAILDPTGRVLGVHQKIHPFLGEGPSVEPGKRATAISTALGTVGVEICFDSCFTGVTRETAAAGARLVAMPNYDPPAPGFVLHHLHAAMLPFRAAENRVPFVRADDSGFSQIIDARGRILAQSPLDAQHLLIGDVTLGDGKGTPFTRLGDWFAYLCLLAAAGALFAKGKSGKRQDAAEPT
jgi:apolipoprotein N-acyltransferase